MSELAREFLDAHPSPSRGTVPVGPSQLDRLDDDLHLGWSWYRHSATFRRMEHPRILDAGCGTGVSTLGLARLNSGAKVVGLDRSERALTVAAERSAAMPGHHVEFRPHDLETRLPTDLGTFDFIVCRGVLGWADDPAGVLANLARSLDPRGLILATFPNRETRGPIRQFRRAIEILTGPDASLDEKAATGRDLFANLRPDYPVRRIEAASSGANLPDEDRIIQAFLGPEPHEWTLPEAANLVQSAGLRFLYASSRRPWQPGRVFGGEPSSDLQARVGRLDELSLATLRDALDPSLYGAELRIYACLDDYEPTPPGWFEQVAADPSVWTRLVPHRTGLAAPVGSTQAGSGPVNYRAVTGAVGPIDPRTHALDQEIDGIRTCDAIDQEVAARTGLREPNEIRSQRWLDLANNGFILLESLDDRQRFSCVHRGPILDRLDCACPRRWVRECERHQTCVIDSIPEGDARRPALRQALERLGISEPMVCATCPDFQPEGVVD
jgi:SAM-dependent methyltransferase